jgi:electron transfer flavoprotein alpha subunit
MRVKLSMNCPFAELSLGNGIIINKDSDWIDVEETTEVKDSIKDGFLEYEGKLEDKKETKQEKSDKEEVWVFAEVSHGKLARVSLELLGKGQELAESLNVKLSAILLTDNDKFSKELIAYGADKVYILESSLLKNYDTELYTKVITDAIKKYKPQIAIYFFIASVITLV